MLDPPSNIYGLYSLFSKRKKQRGTVGKKRWVVGFSKRHTHMGMVRISMVAGSGPLRFTLCSLSFHFPPFTSQNKNQIAIAAFIL